LPSHQPKQLTSAKLDEASLGKLPRKMHNRLPDVGVHLCQPAARKADRQSIDACQRLALNVFRVLALQAGEKGAGNEVTGHRALVVRPERQLIDFRRFSWKAARFAALARRRLRHRSIHAVRLLLREGVRLALGLGLEDCESLLLGIESNALNHAASSRGSRAINPAGSYSAAVRAENSTGALSRDTKRGGTAGNSSNCLEANGTGP